MISCYTEHKLRQANHNMGYVFLSCVSRLLKQMPFWLPMGRILSLLVQLKSVKKIFWLFLGPLSIFLSFTSTGSWFERSSDNLVFSMFWWFHGLLIMNSCAHLRGNPGLLSKVEQKRKKIKVETKIECWVLMWDSQNSATPIGTRLNKPYLCLHFPISQPCCFGPCQAGWLLLFPWASIMAIRLSTMGSSWLLSWLMSPWWQEGKRVNMGAS